MTGNCGNFTLVEPMNGGGGSEICSGQQAEEGATATCVDEKNCTCSSSYGPGIWGQRTPFGATTYCQVDSKWRCDNSTKPKNTAYTYSCVPGPGDCPETAKTCPGQWIPDTYACFEIIGECAQVGWPDVGKFKSLDECIQNKCTRGGGKQDPPAHTAL